MFVQFPTRKMLQLLDAKLDDQIEKNLFFSKRIKPDQGGIQKKREENCIVDDTCHMVKSCYTWTKPQ